MKMDFDKMNDSQWRATNSNINIGHDVSIAEPLIGEFDLHDDKNLANTNQQSTCDEKNDEDNNIVAIFEEGLLDAMNNLQINSVKKLQRFRVPMMPSEKKLEENKIHTEDTPSQIIKPDVKKICNKTMKLLSVQSPKQITKTSSSKLIKNKPKVCENMSMNQSTSKHIIKTISNTETGVHLKDEKINFFGIPVTVDYKKRTQVMPFNFQNKMKNKQLQESKAMPSKLISCASLPIIKTKSTVKSYQNNIEINRKINIPMNNADNSQNNKQINRQIPSTTSQNFSNKNITIRKIITKSTKDNLKTDKENNMSINNIIELKKQKSKVTSINSKLHTNEKINDRQIFDAKLKQRALEIEEMRSRVEQKKRDKAKLAEITKGMKIEAKVKIYPKIQ